MRRSAAALVVPLLLLAGGCRAGIIESRSTPEATASGAVPLQVVEGQGGSTIALVPVFVHDEGPFLFALDTGASRSVIDITIAQRLGLKQLGSTRAVAGVFGKSTAERVEVQRWRAGTVTLQGGELLAIDLHGGNDQGPLGLLGSDVLSRFGEIVIDYTGERLVMR